MRIRFAPPALSGNMFCKHSMWPSTCTFLGCTPDSRRKPCVTMVTVFLAYPYPYPINIVTTVTIVTKTGKPPRRMPPCSKSNSKSKKPCVNISTRPFLPNKSKS